jgi:WD40 repeat protein
MLYSPDLELRAFALEGGDVSLHQVKDDQEVALLPSPGADVQWLHTFSPDGRLLAVAHWNQKNYVWDVQARKLILKDLSGESCDFTSDSGQLVMAGADGIVRFFSTQTGKELGHVKIGDRSHALHTQPGGKHFASFAAGASTLNVYEMESGRKVRSLSHPSELSVFSWSADGSLLAAGCVNGQVLVWDVQTGAQKTALNGHEDNVSALGFNHGRLECVR